MPVIKVKGMSCQHCVKSVTETMEKIGATDVSVDLLSGDVTYAENTPIDMNVIKDAITKIGFEYVG
ncbi:MULTISPECIES: cation transporter [unclassified Pseudodesulfovibrio]|uniref:heavy-metal-associated domain-containing protein n=1 Tax=unclassified Pseudodesulfovibrio TaxID=2661612 RepID=UPI000FEBEC19|nr:MULTISPECIES: cation transporter [unclassified Pseudodesulfovibrio]MCJ2165422.1 cation transporter [Pseudodesulfovibrio sp. S3-i]RWU03175.1 heavy-metal-associated domain-containing protein [Pseudodesulfovibrio sp. S3]